ncbi:MAG: hypothetical protein IKQ40_04810 [Lachnospiraceae bacterium]|nr:hypothetical protein [Lachnospiraceae bacterium]
MEIVVLVLGIVGFVMSWVIVGAVPAALAVILGSLRLLMKKKRLSKLGRVEIVIGIVFAVLAIIVSVYVYAAGIMDIDFVKVVREFIDGLMDKLPFGGPQEAMP